MKQIIYNGKPVKAGKAVITAGSRGFRFGDGCFETFKTVNGKISLQDLHFGRLLSSLDALQFKVPNDFSAVISEQVNVLLRQNGHGKYAKIRVVVFRGEGGIHDVVDDSINYIIESSELEEAVFNEAGLVVSIYKDARKQSDHFSFIKSNNFLPYIMAARWAREQELDDALLLNGKDRIADATIANVFIVSDGILRTPVLSEGCISGVMRKHIINSCRKEGIPVEETTISVHDLQQASEVFLTNAITGIRWVKEIDDYHYTCQVSKLIYKKMVKPLWL